MKKLLALILATVTMVSVATAEEKTGSFKINIHPLGYMNHAIITKYDVSELTANYEAELNAAFSGQNFKVSGNVTNSDVYNMYALGLDLIYDYLYAALSFGIPTRSPADTAFDPYLVKYPNLFDGQNKLSGAVIMDLQLGGGISVLKDLPIDLYLGGAFAINWFHSKRAINPAVYSQITSGAIQSLYEARDQLSFGLGVFVNVDYMFIKNVGVTLSITDSFLPLKGVLKRKFTGKYQNGFEIDSDPTESTDPLTQAATSEKNVKWSMVNNFALRAGVEFKF